MSWNPSWTKKFVDPFLDVEQMVTPPKSKSVWDAMANNKDLDAKPAPAPGPSGDLTEEESKRYGGSRAYRQSIYATSPTGVLNQSPRRGSRLTGS